jgi:RNA polymerase sigma-70 factor (ECF subfamily)
MRFSAEPGSSASIPGRLPASEPLHLSGLLQAVTERHSRAFSDLYDCTHARIYATARSILKSKHDAEEIVSDVFMYVWEHAHCYDFSRGEVMAWLSVITRNRSISYLRRRRNYQSIDDRSCEISALASDQKCPESVCALWQESRMLHKQVTALSPLRQRLLTMSFFHELSHQNIADALKLPPGTVKSHIRRALLGLHAAMTRSRRILGPEFEAN